MVPVAIVSAVVVFGAAIAFVVVRRARLHKQAREQLGRIADCDQDALRRVADDAHHERHTQLERVTGRHDAADIQAAVERLAS